MTLREAHAHLFQHGRAMRMVRLDTCRDLHDALDALRQAPTGDAWILGVGMRMESWPERRYPTLDELDLASPDRPCALWSFDHHALLANSRALDAVGISGETPDPPTGRIIRDRGRPTGLLLESAAKLLWERVPEPCHAFRLDMIEHAARDLLALGFEEVHDLLSPTWLGHALSELDSRRRLPIRVRLHPRVEHLREVAASAQEWTSSHVELAGGKVFADGTLNSRTAAMLHPYADPIPDLPRGQPMLSADQLCEAMALTRAMGLDLAVHAIGDAAVRTALEAWSSLGPPPARARLRVEHAELIDAEDVPRLARDTSVIVSVQPCHLLADIEALRRGLPHRLDRVLPLRDLIDAGCAPGERLWFGSDVPIVRADPADSLLAAVKRRRKGMDAADAVAPSQAISEAEAWACFAGAG